MALFIALSLRFHVVFFRAVECENTTALDAKLLMRDVVLLYQYSVREINKLGRFRRECVFNAS